MPEKDALWYDDLYLKSKEYRKPAHQSTLYPVYLTAAMQFQAWGINQLIDLGCGPAQFGEVALGLPAIRSYTGLDFSPRALRLAADRELHNKPPFEGPCLLLRHDLRKPIPAHLLNRSFGYACLETLEHITEDLGLLAQIPAGAQVVFTVPNFHYVSHVRHFPTLGGVRARYNELIAFNMIMPILLRTHSTIYLAAGARREG